MSGLPYNINPINQLYSPSKPIHNYHNFPTNTSPYNYPLPQDKHSHNEPYILKDNKNLRQEEYRSFLDQQIQQTRDRKNKEQSDNSIRANSLLMNNEILNPKELEKKKKNEYQMYLKQQMEEKAIREAKEKEKWLAEDKKIEEECIKMQQKEQLQQQQSKTPPHLRPSSNTNSSKISLTGNSIIESNQQHLSSNNILQRVSSGITKQSDNPMISPTLNTIPNDSPMNLPMNNLITNTIPPYYNNTNSNFHPNTYLNINPSANNVYPNTNSNFYTNYTNSPKAINTPPLIKSPPSSYFNNNLQHANVNQLLNNIIDSKFDQIHNDSLINRHIPLVRQSNSNFSIKSPNNNTQSSFHSKNTNANLKIDNCVNEIINSRVIKESKGNNQNDIGNVEKIDFSALDYHSKYENTIKGKEGFNETITEKDFDESMKGVSKFVQADLKKGAELLATWKKGEYIDEMRQSQSNWDPLNSKLTQSKSKLMMNAGVNILNSSQSNFRPKNQPLNTYGNTNDNNHQALPYGNDTIKATCFDHLNQEDFLYTLNDNNDNKNMPAKIKENRYDLFESNKANYNSLTKQDDVLCNILYDESDSEKEFSNIKKNKGNIKVPVEYEPDEEIYKLDFFDGDDIILSKDKESDGIVNEDINDIRSTAKFQSHMNFYEESSNYPTFGIKKNQHQKVLNHKEKYYQETLAPDTLIQSIQDIPFDYTIKQQQLKDKEKEEQEAMIKKNNLPIKTKPLESSEEIQEDSMYDKLLDDIEKYREMAVIDESSNTLPKRFNQPFP